MSEENTKVSDLPQDEQDALINEAKELNVRGFYTQMKVSTLKTKIEQAKVLAKEDDEQELAADEQNSPTAEGESVANPFNAAEQANIENDEQLPSADEPAADEKPAKAAQTNEPAADEQTPAEDESVKEEIAPVRASNVSLDCQGSSPCQSAALSKPKVEKGKPKAYSKTKDTAPAVIRICHICRSKVINGKCTGCGFELNT